MLALGLDSRVAQPREYKSFAALINGSRWEWKPKRPILSLSYMSSRVPTLLCAQPSMDTFNCGAFDLVLLFEARPRFWQLACGASLSDACGQNLCVWRRRLDDPRRIMKRCPSSSAKHSWLELCRTQGGGPLGGRCWVPTGQDEASTAPLVMEDAMLGLQRSCRGLGEAVARGSGWRRRGARGEQRELRAPAHMLRQVRRTAAQRVAILRRQRPGWHRI